MKSQDVVILLKLISLEQKREQGAVHLGQHLHGDDPLSVRGLEAALGISKTEVNASIKRSLFSGLAIKDRESGQATSNRRNLYNFIVHGLKFAFRQSPAG